MKDLTLKAVTLFQGNGVMRLTMESLVERATFTYNFN